MDFTCIMQETVVDDKLNSVIAYNSCIWASANAGPANKEVAAEDNANYTPPIALRGL